MLLLQCLVQAFPLATIDPRGRSGGGIRVLRVEHALVVARNGPVAQLATRAASLHVGARAFLRSIVERALQCFNVAMPASRQTTSIARRSLHAALLSRQ